MRLLVTLAVAVAASAIAWVKVSEDGYASDFALFWVAGQAVIAGQNPYAVVQPGGPYGFDSGFMYPMAAAIVVAPIAALPIFSASILFGTLGFACLAFALTRDGWWRLPILMGFPTLWCLRTGQWAPLVAAAALTPAFAWAAACKPTLGFAAFLSRPSRQFVLVAGAVTLAAFAIHPSWPSDWLSVTRTRSPAGSYHVPVVIPGGALLLASVARWRRPEARLLLGMSIVPQTMLLYDQIALGLLAQSRRQAILFGLWSYGAMAAALFVAPQPFPTDKPGSLAFMARAIVWGYYLPALAVVLLRPNEGPAPAWVERLVKRLPLWLRGQATAAAQ